MDRLALRPAARHRGPCVNRSILQELEAVPRRALGAHQRRRTRSTGDRRVRGLEGTSAGWTVEAFGTSVGLSAASLSAGSGGGMGSTPVSCCPDATILRPDSPRSGRQRDGIARARLLRSAGRRRGRRPVGDLLAGVLLATGSSYAPRKPRGWFIRATQGSAPGV